MRQRDIRLLVLIVAVAAMAVWVALPTNPGIHLKLGKTQIDRDIRVHQGLDLQGGMEVLLQADVPEGETVSADAMDSVRGIVENRVNGLGVTEPVVQAVGTDRILVQLPGIADPDAAVATLKETGLMEWVDTGAEHFPSGVRILTDLSGAEALAAGETAASETVYHTILTGKNLRSADVVFDQNNLPVISFELDAEGGQIFGAHTAANIGRHLAIVLDNVVVSCPSINSAIPDGRGQITGSFTVDEAKATVLQLRYGALPVPLTIVDTRTVGPTLGEESVNKSVRAGAIGLGIVLLFMLIYYRLPGLLADVALVIYALLTLALYKLIPVTLTLPGIAGFLLSVGMAVDANILIFERMREELRAGSHAGAGYRRRLSARLDLDPGLQHLDLDHLRHPVVLWQQLWRQHGQGLCRDAGHRRVGEHVHGRDGHAHFCARRLCRQRREAAPQEMAAGRLGRTGLGRRYVQTG